MGLNGQGAGSNQTGSPRRRLTSALGTHASSVRELANAWVRTLAACPNSRTPGYTRFQRAPPRARLGTHLRDPAPVRGHAGVRLQTASTLEACVPRDQGL